MPWDLARAAQQADPSTACTGPQPCSRNQAAARPQRRRRGDRVLATLRLVAAVVERQPSMGPAAQGRTPRSVRSWTDDELVTPPDLPLADSLRREHRQMLARLRRSRERARLFQDLAEQAADQVEADERLVRSLAEVLGISAQVTLDELDGALRGQRLCEVAIAILAEQVGAEGDIHYRDWYALLEARDLVVAGRDPLATFLTHVSRSDRVEAVGRRSGRYRLRAVA